MTINDKNFWITVDPIFKQKDSGHDYISGGFVARISADYEQPAGFIPYVGEFIKDNNAHTKIFSTEDAARNAAETEITKRLKNK